MFNRPHCCAFITGTVLLLLALALVVYVEVSAHPPTQQVQRAHVAQVVSHLSDRCIACHSLSQVDPLSADGLAYAEAGLVNDQTPAKIEVVSLLQYQLDTQLIDVGQRILDLPAARDQRVEVVIEEFLQAYDQANAPANQGDVQLALWRLAGIEELLRTLEHQAAPHQLVRQERTPDRASLDILPSATTLPDLAGQAQVIPFDAGLWDESALPDSSQYVMPLELALATHRRGPPAGVCLDSVL